MPLLEFLLFIKSETRLTKYFSSFHRKWKHLCQNLCYTRWSQRGLGKGWATGRLTPLGRSEFSIQTGKKENNEKEKKDKKTALLWKPLTLFGPGWGHIVSTWHVFAYIRANTCPSLLKNLDFPNFLNHFENGKSFQVVAQKNWNPNPTQPQNTLGGYGQNLTVK